MTKEHLKYCKQRAMEYIELNQPVQAVASMSSDLMKYDETRTEENIERIKIGHRLLIAGADTEPSVIQTWIEQF